MATKEMYDKIKNLTKEEIVEVAENCCGNTYVPKDCYEDYEDDFCELHCPYLDVRAEETNPNRFCRQWVMHDLLKIIKGEI